MIHCRQSKRNPGTCEICRTERKRLPGLIAHAEHNISTGKLEGFNNKIKVSKRIGYGYRMMTSFSCSSDSFRCRQSDRIPHESVKNLLFCHFVPPLLFNYRFFERKHLAFRWFISGLNISFKLLNDPVVITNRRHSVFSHTGLLFDLY